ncbi:hypothetical protein OIV83_006105 [Microbotryomycetes sp. JL201]|nr:hypothetical protein OIV83_006105 [Microbotryomycetes sp. JL201]
MQNAARQLRDGAALQIEPTPSDRVILAREDTSERQNDDEDPTNDVGSSLKGTKPSRSGSGHKKSASHAPLLDSTASPPSSPSQLRRQQRLRAGYLDEEAGFWSAPTSFVHSRTDKLLGLVRRNEGFLLIALAQAFFASIGTCVKILQERIEMPVWEIILIRMFVTWLGCYWYMRWTNVEHPLLGPPGVRLMLVARGVVGFFGLAPGYFALKYLSLSDATVLSFLAPVLVGLLARVFLKETYSKLEATTGFVSLFGVVLIAKPTFLFGSKDDVGIEPGSKPVTAEERAMAVGIALLGTLGAAGAYLIIRAIGKRANALHSISYFAIYSCVVACVFPLVVDAPPVLHLNLSFFLLITPIGVFGFIAQALLTLGLQKEKAGRGTLAVYSNLLFAILLERVVFHHLPDVWSVIGATIIVGGAVRVALDKSKKQADPAESDKRTDDSRSDLRHEQDARLNVPDQIVEERPLQDLTSTHAAR